MKSLIQILSLIVILGTTDVLTAQTAPDNQETECCQEECCVKIGSQLKNMSKSELKKYYERARKTNDAELVCCGGLLHRIQRVLIDSLPLNCSKRDLLETFGKPDRVSRKFTYLEKSKYFQFLTFLCLIDKHQVYTFDK